MRAVDMAAGGAGGRLDGVVHHADHRSNYTALVYMERIVELGAVPSTGTVGDLWHALAEEINDLCMTEPIGQRALATVERLHGELDMRTPVEVESAYYVHLKSARPVPAAGPSSTLARWGRFCSVIG